jgi:hypothetical protein
MKEGLEMKQNETDLSREKDDVVHRLHNGMLSPEEAKILLTRLGSREEEAEWWINDTIDKKLNKLRNLEGL